MRRLLSAAIALTTLLVRPRRTAWTWPADGPILRPFSLSSDPYAAGQHRGVDIGAPEGDARSRAHVGHRVLRRARAPNGGRAVTILTPRRPRGDASRSWARPRSRTMPPSRQGRSSARSARVSTPSPSSRTSTSAFAWPRTSTAISIRSPSCRRGRRRPSPGAPGRPLAPAAAVTPAPPPAVTAAAPEAPPAATGAPVAQEPAPTPAVSATPPATPTQPAAAAAGTRPAPPPTGSCDVGRACRSCSGQPRGPGADGGRRARERPCRPQPESGGDEHRRRAAVGVVCAAAGASRATRRPAGRRDNRLDCDARCD